MKKTILLAALIIIMINVKAQLKTTTVCPAMTVDLLDGKVNDIKINFTVGQIKERLPCFTSAEEESPTAKCGGGVFYKDRDIYFYTGRDYIEIGPKFKGKISIPIMGANRNSHFKWLGNPKIKDVTWDAYATSYGLLILYYSSANKVNKIRFSNQSAETIKLCE
ncbi:MAG TPA: hypothetical protein VIZ28_00760 [Chitinophagaceae bacterium]